jgi:hypothetical protein
MAPGRGAVASTVLIEGPQDLRRPGDRRSADRHARKRLPDAFEFSPWLARAVDIGIPDLTRLGSRRNHLSRASERAVASLL